MKVTVEKLPGSEARFDVDYSWEELEKASDKAYRKIVQKIDIRGFRRGKAPRSLVERQVGKEYIYHEGLDELMNETYRDALKENDITPLDKPAIDAPELEIGQPYHFSATVPVLTPVELGDYHSLHFDREEVSVTSEEVEEELERLRDSKAHWDETERPVEMGDRVTVDLKLTAEEQTVSDLHDNPFELTTERHGLFSGLDEHLVGMSVGESKTFTTTIPADYTNEKLAGKEGQYEVTLHKIEVKVRPELDDALAMEISGSETGGVEDLRKEVSDELLSGKKRRVNSALRELVLNTVIEQSTFSLHPLLIKEEVDAMEHQQKHTLEDRHMSMEQFLMLRRQTREEYRAELEVKAEESVKRQLVLSAIAKQEDIQLQQEQLESMMRVYQQIGQPIQTEEQLNYLASSLMREQAISRLVELTTDPDPDAVQVEEEAEPVGEASGEAGEATLETTEIETPLPETETLSIETSVEAQA